MFVKVLISVLVLICENMSLMSAWNRLAVFWSKAELHIPHVRSSLYQILCRWPENPPFSTYKMVCVGQEFHGIFDHFINKKTADSTKWNTNLMVQVVCSIYIRGFTKVGIKVL